MRFSNLGPRDMPQGVASAKYLMRATRLAYPRFPVVPNCPLRTLPCMDARQLRPFAPRNTKAA
eukprot:903397-Heterocapsa_arctica.AAC.1